MSGEDRDISWTTKPLPVLAGILIAFNIILSRGRIGKDGTAQINCGFKAD